LLSRHIANMFEERSEFDFESYLLAESSTNLKVSPSIKTLEGNALSWLSPGNSGAVLLENALAVVCGACLLLRFQVCMAMNFNSIVAGSFPISSSQSESAIGSIKSLVLLNYTIEGASRVLSKQAGSSSSVSPAGISGRKGKLKADVKKMLCEVVGPGVECLTAVVRSH
jgi:hypothetical protein